MCDARLRLADLGENRPTNLWPDEGRRQWIGALSRQLDLSKAEQEALARLPVTVRRMRADTDIVRKGVKPSHCSIILDGYAWRYQVMATGKRQVLSIHMAGDIPDLPALHLHGLDYSIGTLSTCVVGIAAHDDICQLGEEVPGLWEAFWRATLLDAGIARAWLTNIGVQQGAPRTAHLICELYTLASQRGIADGKTFPLPLTQAQLADALGMTPVNVNRAMRLLKEANFISFLKQTVVIHDYDELAAYGNFDPAYLSLPLKSRATNNRR